MSEDLSVKQGRQGYQVSFFDKAAEHILEKILFRRHWSAKLRDDIAVHIDSVTRDLSSGSKERVIKDGLRIASINKSLQQHKRALAKLRKANAVLTKKLEEYENEDF